MNDARKLITLKLDLANVILLRKFNEKSNHGAIYWSTTLHSFCPAFFSSAFRHLYSGSTISTQLQSSTSCKVTKMRKVKLYNVQQHQRRDLKLKLSHAAHK